VTWYLSRDQVRQLDRQAIEDFGLPDILLMENAGRAAADFITRLGLDGLFLICCGKGNNGGDGFVIARHLDIQGIPVALLLAADPDELQGAAGVNYRIVKSSGISLQATKDANVFRSKAAQAACIVDGLFGTGLTGAVRPPLDDVIRAINDSNRPVVAIDIPSGLDCDSGFPLGATIRATHTITFVAHKKGFAEPGSKAWTGEVHVAGIGAPRLLLERFGGP
jgi:NAD(P)H-hydrate epimerase